MPFQIKKTRIDGLMIVSPHCSIDERGCYKKYYEESVFASFGLPVKYGESSDIISHKGVIRGLHYQTECSQGKLLHVIRGEIFDVALDLREQSKTFGQYEVFYLREQSDELLYIPEGFAHGFLALKENTVFSYQCTGKYVPKACGGIIWNDKKLNIPWPLNQVDSIILSEKDKALQTFEEYQNKLETGTVL